MPKNEKPVIVPLNDVLPDITHMSAHPTPDRLARLLESSIKSQNREMYEGLSGGQKAFLKAWLLSLSGYITNVTEEKRRLHGEIPVREVPTASSQLRTYEAETALYNAMLDGSLDPKQTKKIANPDAVTYTAHPNFSETPAMIRISQDIMENFLGVPSDEMSELQKRSPQGAKMLMDRILSRTDLGGLFTNALDELHPREKRSRTSEINELNNLVPGVIKSRIEEIAVMLKRAENIDVKIPETLSYDQLMNFVAATSNRSSWVTDGDGKRTSRAWDNEQVIIAEKRISMQEQRKYLLESMKDLPERSQLMGQAQALVKSLESDIAVFEKLEKAGAERMEALTKMQAYWENNQESVTREEEGIKPYRKAVREKSEAFQALMFAEGMTESLREDKSAKVLDFAKQLKEEEMKGTISFSRYGSKFDDATRLSTVDGLIISAAKGDFHIKIERRENASQYKGAMRHFLENSVVRKALLEFDDPVQKIDTQIYQAAIGKNDDALHAVLESLSRVMDAGDERANTLKEALKADYKTYARTLEPDDLHLPPKTKLHASHPSEIAADKALFLDDTSAAWMSGLYPDAFERSIIAEAATPDIDVLKKFDAEEIREQVLLRGKSDALTVDLIHRLLDSSLQTTSLLEDPYTVLNKPELLEQVLNNPLYHHAMGIDLSKAEENTLLKLNKQGKPEPLTAYEFMLREGFTDEMLQERDLKIKELKKTYVYVSEAEMLANSDASKRGSPAASTLNDISCKEAYLVGAKNPIGEKDGQKYMFVSPTYLGQGGSIVRVTGVNTTVPIYTEQGTQAHLSCGVYSAPQKVNRLAARQADLHENALTLEGQERRVLEGTVLGNPDALKNPGIEAEKENAMHVIDNRIKTSRDDPRYMMMNERYGIEGMNNYSNRPAGRSQTDLSDEAAPIPINPNRPAAGRADSKNRKDFTDIRAIGLGAMEQEMFVQIMNQGDLFRFDRNGRVENIDEMAKFYIHDQTGNHNLNAAIFALNMYYSSVEEKWAAGGVKMSKSHTGKVTLQLEGEEPVNLRDMERAYDVSLKQSQKIMNKAFKLREEGKDAEASAKEEEAKNHLLGFQYNGFDAADLAMAKNLANAERLLKGIDQVKRSIAESHSARKAANQGDDSVETDPSQVTYGQVKPILKVDPMSLVPPSIRETMEYYLETATDVRKAVAEINKIPAKERTEEEKLSRTMGMDAYFQLFESGPPAIGRVNYIQAAQEKSAAIAV